VASKSFAFMDFDFTLNRNISYQIFHIGPDAEPLILIDGLMNDAQSLVDYASSEGAYGPAGAAYPGVRCAVPEDYNRNLHAALEPLLHEVFAVPLDTPLTLDASFSLVTESPETLQHNQRIPHTDQNGPYNLAMVHYLCGPEFAGTAFFRHRATGWQRITEDRLDEYNRTLNREINSRVMPAGFPDADHPFFEQVATTTPAFDRLVIYRASILHSPAIQPGAMYSADPRKGRLTITAFLNPKL
jgi:hypothetical protein